MEKLLLLSTMCLIANAGFAMELKPYVEGKISSNFLKAKYQEDGYQENVQDNVWGGSLEVGAKYEQFRLGLEGYYNADIEDRLLNILPVKGKTQGLFLNAYYDIPMHEKLKQLKPYIGAGIGYSWLKETAEYLGYNGTSKDKDWGWNLGLGIAYGLNDNVDLTLGYRYEDLGKIKDSGSTTKFTNNKFSFGLRYTF